METLTYKFKDGTEISGSIEKIEKAAAAFGEKIDLSVFKGKIPRGYYPSETKGMTKISEMNEYHLRRALLKRGKDYLAEIYNPDDSIPAFLKKFTDLSEDQIVQDLFFELNKRNKK